jgi:hypothetical protein
MEIIKQTQYFNSHRINNTDELISSLYVKDSHSLERGFVGVILLIRSLKAEELLGQDGFPVPSDPPFS